MAQKSKRTVKKAAKTATKLPTKKKPAPSQKGAATKAPIAKKAVAKKKTAVKAAAKKVAPKKKVLEKVAKAAAGKKKQTAKPLPAKKVIEKKVVEKKAKIPADDKNSKKALKPDTSKVPTRYAFLTVEQYQRFLEAKEEWQDKTNQQIKDSLKKNGQTMSGNKDEILERLADGIVLGSIPRCPYCFGGRPKFNAQYGTYHCVGFRDDTDFKWCRKTMNFGDLPRTPWIA